LELELRKKKVQRTKIGIIDLKFLAKKNRNRNCGYCKIYGAQIKIKELTLSK